MDQDFDVAIIGGSVAGLSAAMTLGRSLRKVAVFDRGTPCNRQAPESRNFITCDGMTPSEIVGSTLEEVLNYKTTRHFREEVHSAKKTDSGFLLTTAKGTYSAKRLLLATGLRDITPDIKGFAQCWGRSILHCPYCHGYECRGKATGIIANGEAAYHLGTLINNWTDKITILTNGVSELRNEEREKLEQIGISIVEDQIDQIRHDSGIAKKVIFKSGKELDIRYYYASIPFEQQSDLAEALGCKITNRGHIDVDDEQRTSIEGVYAAGDCTSQPRAISVAAASGTKAGFTINVEMILKD